MTFKISIDPTTELGKHLSKYTPRQRNNQLIELATIGLTRLGAPETTPSHIKPAEAKPTSTTQSVAIETAPQPGSPPQNGVVDFGDDLMLID